MKTTAARLSALYFLLFAVSAVALVFYVTSLSSRMLVAQVQATIEDEVSSLGRAYERGGLPVLMRVVAQRARQPGANLYLIADPNGRTLAGNVESLEPGVLDVSGWTQKPFNYKRYGEASRPAGTDAEYDPARPPELTHLAIAQVLRLPNTMIVLVGRDLGEPERFQNVIRNSLAAALGLMGIGALLIWYFVGRRALVRIDRVSQASRRIMGGDLSGRLPVTDAGDEFDRLAENLNTMLSRIAALNEGLKHVSDNIAHDLKTPLTRLRNRAEAALASDGGTGGLREALEATIAESDQLIRTFNAILMISRLEAGYSAEETAPVDLGQVARDVFELYEPVAEDAGVALTLGAVDAIAVRGNRELIAQSLSNIVDNAIKYAADAGDAPRVTLSLTRQAGRPRLVVEDNGPGIPAEDRARATERFVRLEMSRSQPGSGLGLSLAKAVMTFHRGSLELDGLEPGLRVQMVFPASEEG